MKSPSWHTDPLRGLCSSSRMDQTIYNSEENTFCKDSWHPKNRGDLLCIWKEWSTTTRTHSFTLIQRIPGVIKYSPFSFSSLLDLYSFRYNGACASPIVSVLVNGLCVCLAAFSVKYSNWTAYSIIFFYLEEAYQRFQSLTSEVLIALKRYIRLLLLGRPYHHSQKYCFIIFHI